MYLETKENCGEAFNIVRQTTNYAVAFKNKNISPKKYLLLDLYIYFLYIVVG